MKASNAPVSRRPKLLGRLAIDGPVFMAISAISGLLVNVGFFLFSGRHSPHLWVKLAPVLSTSLYLASVLISKGFGWSRAASYFLLLGMCLMLGSGLLFRDLFIYSIILTPLIPLFGSLLLGFRTALVFVSATSLGIAVLAFLSFHPAFSAPAPEGRWAVGILVATVNLSVFSLLYQKVLEDSERLIHDQLEEITRMSRVDPLTNIYNRRAFLELLSAELSRATRTRWRLGSSVAEEEKAKVGDSWKKPIGEPHQQLGHISILLFDVDHFKKINDTHGHLAGDAVLRRTGELLQSRRLLRDTDCAARYGGEEFIIYQPDTPNAGAFLTAERFRLALKEERFVDAQGRSFQVTVSCGVAEYREGDASIEDIIHRADQALYRAKGAGRDCTVSADPISPV